MTKTLTIETSRREEMIDITTLLQKAVADSGAASGTLICFVPHTTAGVTINENADPDVRHDILDKLGRVFPPNDNYRHAEGNSDAHIKASLAGFSQQVLFEDGRLILGTWQAVYFCEFDGPRRRHLVVRVVPLA
jgi:secondary thiamine-phosphate synthase enzyme